MKTTTEKLLNVMHVLAWIIFVGLLLKAGVEIVTFVMRFFNLGTPANILNGPYFGKLEETNATHFVIISLLIILLTVLKTLTSWMVLKIFDGIKLANPFTKPIAILLNKISGYLFAIWFFSMVLNYHYNWLLKHGVDVSSEMISTEFLLIVGVVFVFAQLFKRGVELQNENDLTV